MVKGRKVPKQAIDPIFAMYFVTLRVTFTLRPWKSRNIVNLEFSQMLQRKPL